MLTVTKRFKFDAAHFLPYYEGACHNLHGHTYHLDVTVAGRIVADDKNPKFGMIIDFKDLDRIVKDYVIKQYDHSCLNDAFNNPTAEVMVMQIAHTIAMKLPRGLQLISCRLWETEDSYAEYFPEHTLIAKEND